MTKVLATDLDGTLMYPKRFFRCIPRKNVKFIRKWIDAGNRVVFVTSRGQEFMERLHDELQRDFDYITYTSSYISLGGKIIKDESIDASTSKDIMEMIYEEHHPVAYLVNQKDSPLLIKNVSGVGAFLLAIYWLVWFFQGKKREKFILNNKVFDEKLKNGNVYKVMVFFGLAKRKKLVKEINKEIRESYPQVEVSWSGPVVEITPPNCNKGAGIEYYRNYLGIDKKDIYVVGDSGNDISMFKGFYENSYCMAKAYPSVKKHAKHVISRVYKLDEILLNEKGEKNE